MRPSSLVANRGKSWETTCTVAFKQYNHLHMRKKSPPKPAREYLPCKNRTPPAPEVNLCLELARSHVLWSVLSLSKSALSLCYKLSVCLVQFFVRDHQEPGYLCPPVTDLLKHNLYFNKTSRWFWYTWNFEQYWQASFMEENTENLVL